MGAVIANRDVHRRTLEDDGPGRRALLNDKAVLVGGADQSTNLAYSETVSGKFVARRRLATVLGSQAEQVRHTPIVSMGPDVIATAEASSDQGNYDKREEQPTHEMTMAPPPALRQGTRAWTNDAGHASAAYIRCRQPGHIEGPRPEGVGLSRQADAASLGTLQE